MLYIHVQRKTKASLHSWRKKIKCVKKWTMMSQLRNISKPLNDQYNRNQRAHKFWIVHTSIHTEYTETYTGFWLIEEQANVSSCLLKSMYCFHSSSSIYCAHSPHSIAITSNFSSCFLVGSLIVLATQSFRRQSYFIILLQSLFSECLLFCFLLISSSKPEHGFYVGFLSFCVI